MIAEANRLLARDAQHELDLGLTPVAPKAVMVPAPAQELFPGQRQERRWVRRAHVLKTSSGLLYEALAGVYTALGFDAVGDEVFRDLVIARVVEPTSLLDLDRVLAELGRTCASLSTRKRTLRRACAGGYRDTLATACFTHAAHEDVLEAFTSGGPFPIGMTPAGALDIADMLTALGRANDARPVLEDYVSRPVNSDHVDYLAQYLARAGHTDLVARVRAPGGTADTMTPTD